MSGLCLAKLFSWQRLKESCPVLCKTDVSVGDPLYSTDGFCQSLSSREVFGILILSKSGVSLVSRSKNKGSCAKLRLLLKLTHCIHTSQGLQVGAVSFIMWGMRLLCSL
jgi:hypothetical protein